MDETLIRTAAMQELPCADDWRRMWPSAVATMWEAMSQAIGDMSTIANANDRQQATAKMLLGELEGFMGRYSEVLQKQLAEGDDQLRIKADLLKRGLHSYGVEVITELHAAHKQNLTQLTQVRVELQETLHSVQRTVAAVGEERRRLAAMEQAVQAAHAVLRAEREAWEAERRLPVWRRLLRVPQRRR